MAGTRFCDDCRLLKEADHRIANHLSMLSAFVRLKEIEFSRDATVPTAESVNLLLESIRIQTEAVANLHRGLTARRGQGNVDIGRRLSAACAPLAALLAGRIELKEDFAPHCRIAAERLLPLTQIVSEAITNAVKHAYADGGEGEILISTFRSPSGQIVVEVADHGPGLPESPKPAGKGGLGLKLMRALAKQMDAELEFRSSASGLAVRLTLPARAPVPRRMERTAHHGEASAGRPA
jgi:two-component sensor histidine kinase